MAFLKDAISVANITALRALDADSMPKREDGMFISVSENASGQPSFYRYKQSSSASENLPKIVEPDDSVGRWHVYSDDILAIAKILVAGQSIISDTESVTIVAGSNITITTDNTAKTITISSSGGGGGNAFSTVAIYEPSLDTTYNLVADSPTDTVTFAQGNGIELVANTGTNRCTINSTVKSFSTISTGGDSVVADNGNDVLTLTGTNITVTPDPDSDTINFALGSQVVLKNAPNQFTKSQGVNLVNNSFTTILELDLSSGNIQHIGNPTLTSNPVISATNLRSATFVFLIKQDAVGGRVPTFGSQFKFPNGVAPTFSTDANAVDIVSCICDGTSLYCNTQLNFS